MENNYTTYPAVYDFQNQRIIGIENITESNRSNLSCLACRRAMVAVSRHVTPHFRHKAQNNCQTNTETYLHLLAKELFKDISEVELPELLIDDLPEIHRQRFQQMINVAIDRAIPESLRKEFKATLKNNLCDFSIVTITKVFLEKTLMTDFGKIVVDIVVVNEKETILFEPFVSNPINREKRKKLVAYDTSALSIDLSFFLKYFGPFYTVQNLKWYLFVKEYKRWVAMPTSHYDRMILCYEEYLHKEFEKYGDKILEHHSKLDKIKELQKEISSFYEVIFSLNNEISSLKGEISARNDEIKKLENSLGIWR